MFRDLIMRGNNRQELIDWGLRNNVVVDDDQGLRLRRDFYSSPWSGTGKLMRTPGDALAEPPVEPTYVNGYFVLFRFGETRQGAYQQLKQIVLADGVPIEFEGIRGYRWDGIEFAFAEDVKDRAAEWGTWLHEWAGGNDFTDPIEPEPVQ